MSQKFSKNRRQFLKSTLLLSLIIFFNKIFAKKKFIDATIAKQVTNNSIIAFRIWPSTSYTRIIFETTNEANIKYFELQNPHRLVIDFYNCQINNSDKLPINKSNNIIDKIKIGRFSENITRFVFTLKIPINIKMDKLPPLNLYNINYQYRLIFDLYKHMNLNNQDMYQDDLIEIISNKNIKRYDISAIKSNENKINSKGKLLIVIDPGHGGEDPGAIGINGLKEKDIVLDIAKKLQILINKNNHMHSELTRNKDIFIPLNDRVKFARKIHADLFISIHADAFTSNIPKGSSVFILSEKGVSSNFARWLANNQNASDQIGGAYSPSPNPNVNRILLEMSQTWTKKQSNKLANSLLNNLSKEVALHSKYIEEANFVVLRAPDIPSILIETAFLSNQQDAYNLAQEEFREKIANIIYQTLDKYNSN